MAEGVRDDVNVCHLCGALENLSLCGRCRCAWYCSKEHQKEDWKEHKRSCKQSNGHRNDKKKLPNKAVTSECDPITTSTTGLADNGRSNDDMPHEDEESLDQNLDLDLDRNTDRSRSRPTEAQNVDASFTLGDQMDRGTSTLGDNNNTELPLSCSFPHASVSGQKCVNGGQTKSEREEVQVQNSLKTVTQVTKSKTRSRPKSSKKRHKTEESDHSVGNPEDKPLQERFYLNQETHKINLPSAGKINFSNKFSSPSGMGQGDSNSNTLSAVETREQYLLILQARFTEVAKYVVECLSRYGICVIDKFLGESTGHEIFNEVLQLERIGVMKQGQLVHGPKSSRNKHIRGDMITWVDGTDSNCECENIHFLISCMDAVLLESTSKLDTCRINERTKAMVACYPGRGTGYVRHVDNPNRDGRCITCIYYLNKDWDVRVHGGLLRIYPEGSDQVANIEPKFDRLLLFWSDRRNPHEVEGAMKQRYAITVWYYDADERAEALERYKDSYATTPKSQAVPLLS